MSSNTVADLHHICSRIFTLFEVGEFLRSEAERQLPLIFCVDNTGCRPIAATD
jgi:hypothetical protein